LLFLSWECLRLIEGISGFGMGGHSGHQVHASVRRRASLIAFTPRDVLVMCLSPRKLSAKPSDAAGEAIHMLTINACVYKYTP
jgi:hypothetical protein